MNDKLEDNIIDYDKDNDDNDTSDFLVSNLCIHIHNMHNI
mgnify:CR=1 FL=1